MKMAKLIKVLSIDGGGIRGIIPAIVLAEIEKRSKKRISELFNLISGTSTGGILALALNVPKGKTKKAKYTAEKLIELYEIEGENIFSRTVWHRIRSVGNLAEEKYPSNGIDSVLNKYFGDTKLKDSLTDLLVTSYEIERRIPWFFKSWKANDKNLKGYDFPMSSVARATSAAPTYFEPQKIDISNKDYYALVDGGVFANNPAMCAYVEAKSAHPKSDILVVSLGTGELTRRLPYNDVKGWGLANWAQPIISVVFDGVSDTTDYHLEKLLSSDRYFRFQLRLNEGNDDMDDASKTNLRVLKLLAQDLVKSQSTQINKVCKLLNSGK
jgi:patatin-like phospholipase/acyl hydrolase